MSNESVARQMTDSTRAEIVRAGQMSLQEIANEVNDLVGGMERDVWEIGRLCSMASARCEDPDCGVDGPNPNVRFGRWVGENFSSTLHRTLLNYRRMHEVFGARRDEVDYLPQSALYMLAEPKVDEYREEILQDLAQLDKAGVAETKKAISERIIGKRKDAIASQIVEDIGEFQPVAELGDAIKWLERQPQCDLLLTDPPYSTDVDDIAAFAESWLPLALSKLKSTGRAFVFVGAYPQELTAYMNIAMPTQVLVWTYKNTLGPSPKLDYKLNWQAILYYRMPDADPLDCPVMLEQFSVQEINAPDGRLGDRYHAWQKPMEIGERFVRHATQPGDLVLDPFCCTGTFLLAAAKYGRNAIGCDLSPEHLEIAKQRGCKVLGVRDEG